MNLSPSCEPGPRSPNPPEGADTKGYTRSTPGGVHRVRREAACEPSRVRNTGGTRGARAQYTWGIQGYVQDGDEEEEEDWDGDHEFEGEGGEGDGDGE